MALSTEPIDQAIMRAIQAVVRERVAQIAEEEIKGTADRVKKRVSEEMDRLALSVLSQYEMHMHQNAVVIRVLKP